MNGMLPVREMQRLGYSRQTWMTPALRPIVIPKAKVFELKFVHHVTTCFPADGERSRTAHGSTIWIAATADSKCAAVAWEWAEISPGMLCVADILGVTSNIYPLDEEGAVLDDSGRLLILVSAVHTIDWRGVVLEHIPQPAASPDSEQVSVMTLSRG